MTSIHQGELLADMLGKCSLFRQTSINAICKGTDYRIYLGVPVHCLTIEGTDGTWAQAYPHQAIDLLICRGFHAVLAVAFDTGCTELDKLFSQQLRSLPCHALRSEEMIEDVAAAVCGEIEQQLRCDSSDPVYTGCRLRPLTLNSAVSRMGIPSGSAPVFLKEKNLVSSDGTVTNYGRACGLFRQYIPSGQGRFKYVTIMESIAALRRAMAWQDSGCMNRSLENRLFRLEKGLPMDTVHLKTLKQLLDMPLEKLFVRYEQDRQTLNVLLSKAQCLSAFSPISAFGDKEELLTYGDVIYAVRNLWEYTAHGDCRNSEASRLCEDILAFLTFPLWSLPQEEAAPRTSAKKQGLRERLNRAVPSKIASSLVRLPLQHYFHAAASLSESEYPIWLFQNCVKPWLAVYEAADSRFAAAMGVVYKLSQSEEEYEQADYFPLMYSILVEPLTGIV